MIDTLEASYSKTNAYAAAWQQQSQLALKCTVSCSLDCSSWEQAQNQFKEWSTSFQKSGK